APQTLDGLRPRQSERGREAAIPGYDALDFADINVDAAIEPSSSPLTVEQSSVSTPSTPTHFSRTSLADSLPDKVTGITMSIGSTSSTNSMKRTPHVRLKRPVWRRVLSLLSHSRPIVADITMPQSPLRFGEAFAIELRL